MKVRVKKGGWWWLSIERKTGDVLEPPLQSTGEMWVREGLCEEVDDDDVALVADDAATEVEEVADVEEVPGVEEIETADAPEPERAVAQPRKRK